MGKPTMWFPNRSDTNLVVQAQEQARSLKFCSYVEEELYCPSSENKGADQLRGVTAKLICAFVFTYADCWFSHEAAHMFDIDISQNIRLLLYKLNLITVYLKSGKN